MERIAKDMMAELRVGSYPDAGVTSLQVRPNSTVTPMQAAWLITPLTGTMRLLQN